MKSPRAARRVVLFAAIGLSVTLLLAWPMMVLSVMLTDSLPVPMADERTPTIITLWIILVLGWCLLTLICGVILSLRIGVNQLQQRNIFDT